MRNDLSYYVRRATQERAAAAGATDAKVRSAHQQMADRYQALVESHSASHPAKADAAA
jgi:hypothetical protein